ncbi:ribonuclease Trv [Leptodontidium sp. MPI-SDFR-AT-0119]|nr:ribonuclease Trv [Leptodontidium sp. MPI-SDFR-AT-0119]
MCRVGPYGRLESASESQWRSQHTPRFLLAIAALAGLIPLAFAGAVESCSNDASQLACSGTSTDSCCFNTPGGLFQQVQFWDTNPATGPSNSWTIHGLWPNNCDGTCSENCDPTRVYTNITQLLTAAGQTSSNEKFWDHEWATHGTCISTLSPSCYSDYTAGEEAVDFFTKNVRLFQGLSTYTWLANAGITPSSDTSYQLSDMNSALESAFSAPVILLCQDTDVVYEIYYAYNTQGSLQKGTFVPTANTGATSNCPDTVQYLPKS